MSILKPQTLKGFRDFLPDDMRIREKVIATFKAVFEKYGYEPLETPTLEYANILMGKYGEEAEQLIYNFEDRGGRKVAMKYDLTVPTCRVMAQYGDKLPLPFKRYQIQPVWRADNTQKGRFREFYQCDADTFGTTSMIADAEFIQMGLEILGKLGFTNVVARINNRKFIDGLTKFAGANSDQFYAICIAVDKFEKIGADGVIAEMKKRNLTDEIISKIMSVISLSGTSQQLVNKLKTMMEKVPEAMEGLKELEELFTFLKAGGVTEGKYQFDLSIIRGLSYYTGPVWEFTVKDGGVGSVAGCGRYDKLVGLYLGRDIPATGGSFGIERIIEIVRDRDLIKNLQAEQVMVSIFDSSTIGESIRLASQLRDNGIATLLYPDGTVKLEKQLKYANKKNVTYVVIQGPEEIQNKTVKLRNMKTGEQKTLNLQQTINELKAQNSNIKTKS